MHSKEEVYEFCKNLDLSPLYNEICKTLDLPNLRFKKTLKSAPREGGILRISFESDDFVEESKAFNSVFDAILVKDLNSFVLNKNEDKELEYWIVVGIRWYVKGDNKAYEKALMSAIYKNGSWLFFKENYM